MRSSSSLGVVLAAASMAGLSVGFLNCAGPAALKLPANAARRLGALRMSTTDDSKVRCVCWSRNRRPPVIIEQHRLTWIRTQVLNKYSRTITQPKSQGASQAMLYATGLEPEDMNKAQVGTESHRRLVWFRSCALVVGRVAPKVRALDPTTS